MFRILTMIMITAFTLTACNKNDSDGKTCWDCHINCAWHPDRDTVVCNEGQTPNFNPTDPNNNSCGINCTKR
jgi:hypothetical protein